MSHMRLDGVPDMSGLDRLDLRTSGAAGAAGLLAGGCAVAEDGVIAGQAAVPARKLPGVMSGQRVGIDHSGRRGSYGTAGRWV